MFDWLLILQVLVTLLVVPIFSFQRFKLVAKNYVDAYCVEAKNEVNAFVLKSSRTFFITVMILFIVGLTASLHAVIKQVELFRWDNQAGLMVLFFLAMIPVIVLSLDQKNLLKILKSYSGGKRTASLSPLPLRALIS